MAEGIDDIELIVGLAEVRTELGAIALERMEVEDADSVPVAKYVQLLDGVQAAGHDTSFYAALPAQIEEDCSELHKMLAGLLEGTQNENAERALLCMDVLVTHMARAKELGMVAGDEMEAMLGALSVARSHAQKAKTALQGIEGEMASAARVKQTTLHEIDGYIAAI
jgi:hypothetical protein